MHLDPNARKEVVDACLTSYFRSRLNAYDNVGLKQLLGKDILMFALRGVSTAGEFTRQAFAAWESSSEETNMGTFWQQVLIGLSTKSVDAGDLIVQKGTELWVVELKSQTNTLNASGLAQTVRTLKSNVTTLRRTSTPTAHSVNAMIAVVRGAEKDESKVYPGTMPGTGDLEGFRYRYIVGKPLWRWLIGMENVTELLGGQQDNIRQLSSARESALARLQGKMTTALNNHSLEATSEGVAALVGKVR